MSTTTSTLTSSDVARPSWYDVLDVDPTSSETDIRVAWKQAIADLEPADRRFRLLNQAAAVLLDHDRRAAYDTELLAAELDAAHEEHETSTVPATATDDREKSGEPGAPTARTGGWVVPGWLLVAVAAVAALVVGAGTVVAATVPSDVSIADATRDAQAAAERAIVPILSYDGSSSAALEADQRAAEGLMTADYRAEYAKLFEVVKDNAPATRTVVTTEVIASGIVRSGDDRVSVLVFVNRPTTNKQTAEVSREPVVYKDQVTVTMQKVGDEWLVDGLVTSPAGG